LIWSCRIEKFEEKYFDVLQNIEFAIVTTYHQDPEITDHDVLSAVNALIREYQAKGRGRTISSIKLSFESQPIYDSVKMMCEWRLGRAALDNDGESVNLDDFDPLSQDEILACLKRIRKSIGRWNKQGGRQGYLKFIEQYMG
jgi:hypothetical protein